MTRRLLRLLTLSRREVADLFRAQAAILRTTWRMRAVRIGDLVAAPESAVQTLNSPADSIRRTPNVHSKRVRVSELALAIARVAESGITRPACLVRSIALRDLLSSQGIPDSCVRVGVRRNSGQFIAHAWVELHGEVVGDDAAQIALLTPLSALSVKGG